MCKTCFSHARNIPEPCHAFPTCQETLVRFYVRSSSSPSSSILQLQLLMAGHCRTPATSSQSMWALLESAGSQPPGLDRSGHMWALPKPNRHLALDHSGHCRRPDLNRRGHCQTATARSHRSEQCRMPDRMSDRMRQRQSQTECRIE